MNKIHNINLGGYPFTIDDKVYHDLQSYLHTVEKHFSDSDGVCDIMSDIEARMAELIRESMGERQIIGKKDLDSVISTMGTPEQFGAATDEYSYDDQSNENNKHVTTGKRFFRDPDDKIIGGVCSGIAAYWGIEDPIWARLVCGLLLFSGIGFIPYIVLWIIIPVAKTSGDRLAMRGEAANVKNIGQMIEDEIGDMTDQISQMTDNFLSKKKDNKRSKNIFKRVANWIGFAFNASLQVAQSVCNVILSIFGLKKI